MALNMPPPPLRSPRETLGGYVILPRLIDKIRLHARGKLPPEYIGQLLKPGLSLDGRFLTFTELDGKQLRGAILAVASDEEVLAIVARHSELRTDDEKKWWADDIAAYRPSAEGVALRQQLYPELAAQVDIGSLSAFDMIDMDEGRIPIIKFGSQ